MSATFETRLARLEEHRGRATGLVPPFRAATRLLVLLLAVHLGNLMPGEPVEDGEVRALGFDDRYDLHAAMLADSASVFGWSRRHTEACERLLATCDTSLSSGLSVVAAALAGLVAALPDEFRVHPYTVVPSAIDEAAEWLCL